MIQSIHSTLAYTVLAVLLIAVINAFLGLSSKRNFTKKSVLERERFQYFEIKIIFRICACWSRRTGLVLLFLVKKNRIYTSVCPLTRNHSSCAIVPIKKLITYKTKAPLTICKIIQHTFVKDRNGFCQTKPPYLG